MLISSRCRVLSRSMDPWSNRLEQEQRANARLNLGVSNPSTPAPGSATRSPGRRRFPVVRLVLLLVLAWVAFMVFTPLHAWNAVTKVDTTPAGERPAETKGFTYLLVGSDSRAWSSSSSRSRPMKEVRALGR